MAEHLSTSFQPLFDRLATPGQASARPYIDEARFKESIRGELQRLLSCRSRLPFDRFLTEAANVLDYGIPDSTALTMASVDDRARLAKAIQRAITVFEPRLCDVIVDIAAAAENGVDALVYIDAARRGAPSTRRTAFAMTTRGLLHDGDSDTAVGTAAIAHDRPVGPRLMRQEAGDA